MAGTALPRLVDTTLSDLAPPLAGRLRTPQARQIALLLGSLGLAGVEGLGPIPFQACLRDLGEDPWDRLSALASALGAVPLRLALRGQALVGERLYPDDVVRAFIRYAVQRGVRAFRLYDWLNDPANLAVPVEAVRQEGAEAFVGLCYWPDAHETPAHWARRAQALARLGASALVLQDPAGLLTPEAVRGLVPALRGATGLPLFLHLHNTVDTGLASLRAGLEAGAQGADGCLLPLGGWKSPPSLPALVHTLGPEARDPLKEGVRQAVRLLEGLPPPPAEAPDLAVLAWGMPGRLVERIRSHLREVGLEERLEDALAEVPRTRQELGAPPLLGPVGDLVALQAVQNVLFGRWKVVPARVREFVAGYYGHPPQPVDPAVRRRALEELGRPPVPEGVRPADLLDPEMEAAERSAQGLARSLGDVLLCALFPQEGLHLLRVREGQEPPPREEAAPTPSPRARTYRVFVEGRVFQVAVDPLPPRPPAPPPSPPEGRRPRPAPAGPAEVPLTAPMPGVLLRFVVEVGQRVREGETVAYLDAMKMENALTSPASGVVVELRGKPGQRVQKGTVLAIIRREG